MSGAFKRCVPYGLVLAASAWIASSTTVTGDWLADASPAVGALAHGHLSAYLSAKPLMGPFATLVQAPFAALSGASGLTAYRWASFPCLLAAGLLGTYLAAIARRRGSSRPVQVLIAALCLLNPLTLEALEEGHPEELLTAALAVGAVASASEGRRGQAAALLGLAVASKQWAVVAILPALMALPSGRARTRVGIGAGAIAFALLLPGLLAAPGSLASVQRGAAFAGRFVTPWSVWYPVASAKTLLVGREQLTAHVHEAPPLAGLLAHPLIVLLAIALPAALAARRRGFGLSGPDAMGLLALLALLRCALDPANNLYYHEPLLLALLGWDALAGRRRPVAGLAGLATALFFWRWEHHLSDLTAFNTAYLAVAVTGFLAIGATLFQPTGWTCVQRMGARVSELPLGSPRSARRLGRET